MKKLFILLFSFLSLVLPTPANSVEFGQDATGDPNAVNIQGYASGFLYSERIIFTAAHVLDEFKIQSNGDTNGFVFAPGVVDKTNEKRYKIIKAFIPKTFVHATQSTQPIDDFAVIVIEEDMPLKIKTMIATEQQLIDFAQAKTKIEMVGYGLQNGNQRNDQQYLIRAPHKLTSYLYSPEMMNIHYSQYGNLPPFWKNIEWGAVSMQSTGTTCAGDSGSGYFVQQNSVRYYVGTAGNGLGNSNCKADGTYSISPGGAVSWFPNPNKFLDLVKNAELFVEEQKRFEFLKVEEIRIAAELKAKQEADAKAASELKAKQDTDAKVAEELKAKQELEAKVAAEMKAKQEADAKTLILKKITITCFKGNSFKKVTAIKPICPKGYKIK
jgi:V8-like Glu-specific endopeptidase